MGDALNDAEIARILADDALHMGIDPNPYFDDGPGSDSDPDYGKAAKKRNKGKAPKKGKAASTAAAAATEGGESASAGDASGDDDGSRKKRKDTGQVRAASRAWTDEEETLFLEGLALHGRDWKKCAEHVGTRDHKAISSHAQKYLIKALLRGEELPPKMQESGRGYTLSGKPLDPNSAAAKAYGLKPEPFKTVVDAGKLEVGVHVTTFELLEGPAPARAAKAAKTSGGAGGASTPAAKRPRKASGKTGTTGGSSGGGDDGDEDANVKLALMMSAQEAEPTEYVKNRPRRQATAKATLGNTTESLDLTLPMEFVGPSGAGAPLSQPFHVTVNEQALLVMDFHAHLSRCEIIGLLGGRFDASGRKLDIVAAYPCRRVVGSDSGTSVELDAESQVEVSSEMEDAGLIPVGWYHSHPIFEARPSQKDNENQRNYQALCRDISTGLEPWVGAIVGPYDMALSSPTSHLQFWVVRMHNGELTPFNVKAKVTPLPGVPEPGSQVDKQLVTALEQLVDDVGRVDLSSQWRAYSRLILGTPDGPALTFVEKVMAAVKGHLPREMQQGEEGYQFVLRMLGHIEQQWGITLTKPEPPVKVVVPEEAGAEEGGTATATATATVTVTAQPGALPVVASTDQENNKKEEVQQVNPNPQHAQQYQGVVTCNTTEGVEAETENTAMQH